MSIGPFQQLSGSYGMSSENGLANEPWLLPISDGAPPAPATPEALVASVRQSSRRFWVTANALCAVLALLLTAQVATDWMSLGHPKTGQIADATPPTLAAEKAALDH